MRIAFGSQICTVIYVEYFVNSEETIFGKVLFVQKKIATLYTVNIHNNKLSHGIFRTAALKTFFKHLPPPQHFQENILLMSKYTNKVQGRVLLFFLRAWNQIGVAKLCKQRLIQD